jgi:LmbE family N-acetylglucosaminyl deacetylase
MDIRRLGTILSIWAHPDDESYLAAGLMAAARDQGQRVVCVSATAGERGTADTTTWPPERLGHRRRQEAAAAMAILGVAEHRVLGLPDGALEQYEDEGRLAVAGLFDEVDPDTVLTFGADGMTFHPDHVAVHRWVTEAWHARERRARLLYATWSAAHLAEFGAMYEAWNVYMSDERPAGTEAGDMALHLQLDGVGLDRKLAALRAHATQTDELIAAIGPDTFLRLIAEEAFIGARSDRPAPLAVR